MAPHPHLLDRRTPGRAGPHDLRVPPGPTSVRLLSSRSRQTSWRRDYDHAVPPVQPSTWSSTDYALDWPASLLSGELLTLRTNPYAGWQISEVLELLDLGFHTAVPGRHFRAFVGSFQQESLARAEQWIDDLDVHVQQLRPHSPLKPRWRDRARGVTGWRQPRVHDQFFALVESLNRHGYFDRDTVASCPVEPDDEEDHRPSLATRIGGLMGDPTFWRPAEMAWETLDWEADTFYELIEIFHDLAARPRKYWRRDDVLCVGHYHDFDTDSGRRIYRSLVNRLLAEHDIELRLAPNGPDEGRLVELVDEARVDLIQRSLSSPNSSVERVAHAIAQFRHRNATEHDKRSAVLTLAGILEERRDAIAANVGSNDEGALFTIANQFAIRHQRRGQQSDYDPIFLDWIFWWYLATIELTDRLRARTEAASAQTAGEPSDPTT